MTERATGPTSDLRALLSADKQRRDAEVDSLIASLSVPVANSVRSAIVLLGPGDQERVLQQHPGYRINTKVESLWSMLAVFNRVTSDVLARLDEFEFFSKTQDLFKRHSKPVLRRHEVAVNKELVAFAAAASALVALSRRVLSSVPVEGFNSKRMEMFDADEHAFIVDLRNVLLHESFSEATWQITRDFVNREERSDFVLAGNTLGLMKGSARQFVARSGGKVLLRLLISQYAAKVGEFYRWLRDEVELHRPLALTDYLSLLKACRARGARLNYRMLLSVAVERGLDPYAYLNRYLDPVQMDAVSTFPPRSRDQADFIIQAVDEFGACDEELRDLVYRLFGVPQ
jgi:hypothetical protein